MSADKFVVDHDALESVVREFQSIARALLGYDRPLAEAYDKLLAGAGEFSARVQPGAVAFLLSWNEAFQITGESAQGISNNVGKVNIDARNTDTPVGSRMRRRMIDAKS